MLILPFLIFWAHFFGRNRGFCGLWTVLRPNIPFSFFGLSPVNLGTFRVRSALPRPPQFFFLSLIARRSIKLLLLSHLSLFCCLSFLCADDLARRVWRSAGLLFFCEVTRQAASFIPRHTKSARLPRFFPFEKLPPVLLLQIFFRKTRPTPRNSSLRGGRLPMQRLLAKCRNQTAPQLFLCGR